LILFKDLEEGGAMRAV